MRLPTPEFVAGLALALTVGACADDPLGPQSLVEQSFSYEFPSAGITAFDLQGTTGSARIVAAPPGSPIRIEGFRRVRAPTEAVASASLPLLVVDAERNGSSVTVASSQPANAGDVEYIVDFIVSMPGDLAITVSLITGAVEIESVTGSIGVQVVTGTIVLQDTDCPLVATLTTGTVEGSVTLPADATVAVSVVTGTVVLSIPRDAPGVLTASVVTGTLSLSGFVAQDQDPRSGVAQLRLGEGDGAIDVSVVTGTAMLTARQ